MSAPGDWEQWLRRATADGDTWRQQALRALSAQLGAAEALLRESAAQLPAGDDLVARQATALVAALGGVGAAASDGIHAETPDPAVAAGDGRARFRAAAHSLQARLAALPAAAAADLQAQLAATPATDLATLFARWVACYESRLRQLLLDPAFGRDFAAAANSALALHLQSVAAVREAPALQAQRLERRVQRLARRVERLGG